MSSRIALKDLNVVSVEPSTTQYHVIYDYLTGFGVLSIDHFQDAATAIEGMKKRKPDLVISAMHLPDMTGTDLVSTMREDSQLEDVAFMLVSSETGYTYLEPIRQAGAVAILPKPFEPEHLHKALFSALDFIEPEKSIEFKHRDIEDLKVLVVDDSLTARKHIRRTLEGLGIENLVEAVNGVKAQSCLEQQSFDLIVTDYNMPEMDGRALVEFIRNQTDQSGVPILMVTSESDASQLAAVEQSGVSAMCDKPFDVQTVKDLIERIVI